MPKLNIMNFEGKSKDLDIDIYDKNISFIGVTSITGDEQIRVIQNGASKIYDASLEIGPSRCTNYYEGSYDVYNILTGTDIRKQFLKRTCTDGVYIDE
jgi:hypothetical protein